jgi:hypothetical protein
MKICPLCNSNQSVALLQQKHFFYCCSICNGIFRDSDTFIDAIEEKKHYEWHNNDVNDVRYQNFVSPIVESIVNDFAKDDKGLDFGSGTGPVISKMLLDKNYSIEQYDPFFANNPNLLSKIYNYIACCEVIEHFHNPYKEFELLKNLLQNNGKLYCMTAIYDENIDFENWYYKNDPTHVFIYQKETFEWIKNQFSFKSVQISNNRLIVFTNH